MPCANLHLHHGLVLTIASLRALWNPNNAIWLWVKTNGTQMVPKWYPNEFCWCNWMAMENVFFPQSYGKSIGNLTHPHIQSSVEAGAVVIVPVVQVFLDAIDLADQLKASDFQILQTYYVNITRTFGYVWRNCLLVQMFN